MEKMIKSSPEKVVNDIILEVRPEVGEIDAGTVDRMAQILSVLSKYDALSIFLLAREGLHSEMETPAKVGLTKKQYYSRLKQLTDIGLIRKEQSDYVHTSIGSVIYYKYIANMIGDLKNSKNMEMIDYLRKSSRFTEEDIEKFAYLVGTKTMPSQDIVFNRATFTDRFDEMVQKVLEYVEFAKSEVILATRFSSELVINSVLKKSSSGVSVRVLADTSLVQSYYVGEDKIGYNDKNKTERDEVVSNPYYPSQEIQRNYVKVPFCILVVDNKYVGIETVNGYDTESFNGAVFLQNTELASSMKELFEKLWEGSTKKPPQLKTTQTS